MITDVGKFHQLFYLYCIINYETNKNCRCGHDKFKLSDDGQIKCMWCDSTYWFDQIFDVKLNMDFDIGHIKKINNRKLK